MKSRECLDLRLFGVPQLSVAGRALNASPKPLALLAHLALNPEGVTRDALAELLWAPGKLHNVRQAIYSLRNLPGGLEWLGSGDPVTLHAESDVAAFEQAIRAGRYEEALAAWDRSASDRPLFQGIELSEVPAFDDWLDGERQRLHDLYLDALRARISDLHTAGDHAGAARHAETLIRLDPLGEEGYRAAMRAELAQGRRERAIQIFERCRRVLRDELDAEPEAATLDLLREVEGESATRGKRALLLSTPDEVPARPPVLYGREADLAACRARLAEHPHLLVQGFGGMGKTALAATLAAEHVEAGGRALWLELGDDGPEAAFDALAAPFDARQPVARGDVKERAAALANVLTENGVTLLVLDDVWNAYALSRVAEAVPEGVQLLATSRQRYPEPPRLELDRLDRADALALFRHHAPKVPEYEPRADAICALLGDHPFAIRLAGITLHRHGLEVGDLLKQLQEETPGQPLEMHTSLSQLIATSLEKIPNESFEVLLGMCGLLTSSCTSNLLSSVIRRSIEYTEAVLDELIGYGLVCSNVLESGAQQIYFCHYIVYYYMRQNNLYSDSRIVESLKSFCLKNFNSIRYINLESANLLHSKILSSANYDEVLYLLLVEASYGENYSIDNRIIERAIDLIRSYEKRGNYYSMLKLSGKIGSAYMRQFRDKKSAKKYFEIALYAAEALGDAANSILYLGCIVATGCLNFQESKRILKYCERTAYGLKNEYLYIKIRDIMGYCSCIMGDYAESLKIYEELTYKINIKNFDNELEFRRNLFIFNLNLAFSMMRCGRLEECRYIYYNCLSMAEEDENDFHKALVASQLAELEILNNDLEKAGSYIIYAEAEFIKREVETELDNLDQLKKRIVVRKEKQSVT